jgi:PAS domain-containing protein
MRGVDGELLGWVGSVTGVHNLVEAEAALRHGEELPQLFVERTPAAIAMFDREMRYVGVSGRFLVDYGLSMDPQEVLGRSHYDLFSEIPGRWRNIHRRVLAGRDACSRGRTVPAPEGHHRLGVLGDGALAAGERFDWGWCPAVLRGDHRAQAG